MGISRGMLGVQDYGSHDPQQGFAGKRLDVEAVSLAPCHDHLRHLNVTT